MLGYRLFKRPVILTNKLSTALRSLLTTGELINIFKNKMNGRMPTFRLHPSFTFNGILQFAGQRFTFFANSGANKTSYFLSKIFKIFTTAAWLQLHILKFGYLFNIFQVLFVSPHKQQMPRRASVRTN